MIPPGDERKMVPPQKFDGMLHSNERQKYILLTGFLPNFVRYVSFFFRSA